MCTAGNTKKIFCLIQHNASDRQSIGGRESVRVLNLDRNAKSQPQQPVLKSVFTSPVGCQEDDKRPKLFS